MTARDRAGHEASSRIIPLPAAPGAAADDRDPRGPGPAADGPADGRAGVDHVRTTSLTVESKLTKVTRSGVVGAELWVNDGTGWKMHSEKKDLHIDGAAADPVIQMPFEAQKDGRYGFVVVPISGAGQRPPALQKGDPPQWLVEVDTKSPAVAVTKVDVGNGGLKGPRVTIQWDAKDNRENLTADPITLEYADHTAPTDWKPVPRGGEPAEHRAVRVGRGGRPAVAVQGPGEGRRSGRQPGRGGVRAGRAGGPREPPDGDRKGAPGRRPRGGGSAADVLAGGGPDPRPTGHVPGAGIPRGRARGVGRPE